MLVNGKATAWPTSADRSATSCARAAARSGCPSGACDGLHVSVRAGIVVTGTEVLSGIIRRPQRPVAVGAAARARACSSRT